ncbi:MAG TPA: S8 family serine peptidase [Solirubrobacterales bacterium]
MAGVALAAPLAHASDRAYAPGEVVAKLKGHPREHDVTLPAGITVPQAVRQLRASPGVAYANPNYLATAADAWTPNDPGHGQGWSADQWNFLSPGGVNFGGASIQGAWQHARDAGVPGGRGITVAVLDTGVAYRTKGRYSRDPDLPPITRFVKPKDFVDGDLLPLDENGHGTHVASTIAQATDNARGLTGVAYGSTVMPVRVLNRQEMGTASNVARGIQYAVQQGADVINLSLEFKPAVKQCSQIPGVCAAVQTAVSHGVVVVAAAGNHHQAPVAFPARAGAAIAVGASTYRGCLADYSDYGTGLDLVAPGGGKDTSANTQNLHCNPALPAYLIRQYSLDRQAAAQGMFKKFGIFGLEGTSMAAAHVSGVAALLLAEGWPANKVAKRLENCATLPGSKTYYGAGLLDAAAATSAGGC